MKTLVHALVLTGLVGVPTFAMAAEEESPHSLSANVGVTSDYIFRGISQTGGDPPEIYAALGWKWFTPKYSYSISDETFGFANSDGSGYLDISASVPIGETG